MSAAIERTRVCFVLPSLAPGGTERQLLYLLEGLRETHACSVICTRSGGDWAGDARAAGAQLFALNTWGGWDPRIGGRARKIFRAVRPHIVQTFLFGFDSPVNRAARGAGVPVVISSRRELAAWMKPRHVRAQRRANALVDCIVANSQAVARFAARQEGLDAAAIRVIYNGVGAETSASRPVPIETRSGQHVPPGKLVVGMAANFSPVKDHSLFLATAKLLIQRRPDIHFLLVGRGPMQNQFEHAVRAAGMQEDFTITSATSDAAELMRAMDVCVLTSKREGSPNVVLEAMALGRPVVAAAVGGVPEIIEDGANGLLVSTRDPNDYAEAVLRCLDDRAWAEAIGACARERVQRAFSLDRMVESYRALYAELVARAGGAR